MSLLSYKTTCSDKKDSNSATCIQQISKVKAAWDSLQQKDYMDGAIKYKCQKAKESMLHIFDLFKSHLQVLSKEDLKGTRIEHGFKRAFMSVFGQDNDTFTSTMFLNVDQLQKQLDKDDFQEDGSMAAFWVINRQFQKFIDLKFTLDYDSQMSDKYFAEYARIEVKQFRGTLLQHKSNVKKFVAERIRHQRQYDRRVNKRQISRTESEVQDDSSRPGNDTDADDADIRPIYDKEPMAEVQLTTECNIFATRQQHTEQPEIINEAVPIADHSKNSNSFSDSKHFVCSTCHKCVLNVNHDASITKLMKEVNSRVKIQSHKTRNSNKPVDQKSHTQKPGGQIFTGHRFSPNKTFIVYEKTSPRSDLRWKPTGRIFKSVGLRWIPIGKLFDSCTSKVDSEPPHGSNVDIPNIHECKQTLDVSACTSINVQKEQSLDLSAVVSKSSDVPTADASDKRQQQPDSTLSTSTLATTVTADENFNL
ncbi:hypothetical protein Tco_0439664 [Tanacetum coccineum]